MTGIDASLYPDEAPPASLAEEADAADYLQRVCAASDFGLPPAAEVLDALRQLPRVFDRHPLPASPTYHALRGLFGWPETTGLPPLRLRYEHFDLREGRPPDDTLI